MLHRLVPVLVLATTAIACALPDPEPDSQATNAANMTAGSPDAAALDQLAERINNCHRLTTAEFATLRQFTSHPLKFSAQVYVYVSCSTSTEGIVSATTSLETRAGYSTEDGAFTETAIGTSTSINVPLRIVDASGGVAYEHTIRTAGGVTYSSDEKSVGVDVEKELGIATATVSADFNGESATISGGIETPVIIPLDACKGATGSAGIRVELTASANDEASKVDPTERERAAQLVIQNAENVWVMSQAPQDDASQHRVCCKAQSTCTK